MTGLKETKYRFDKRTFKELKSILQVPKFQRGAVWADSTKDEFIRTALNGYPFGALLLYEEDNKKYLLVDGLQRFSTLLDYEKNPYKYISSEVRNLVEKFVDKQIYIKDKTVLLQQLLLGFEKHLTLNDSTQPSKLARAIVGFVDDNQIDVLEIADIIDIIKKKFCISDLPIACMVYEGDYADLPEIFENINSHGISLSKYDIYSATWSGVENTIDDLQLLTTIDNKYNNMSEQTDIKINEYEKGAIINSKRVNLYEYCFAIGELVAKECSVLVSNSIKSKTDINPIGFKLVALLIGSTSVPRGDRLLKCFKEATSEALSIFKSYVVECAREIELRFSRYFVSLDGQSSYYNYNENQITSLIATLFRIKYVATQVPFEFLKRGNNKTNLDNFNKHAHLKMIFDFLSKYWSHGADDKLNSCFQSTLARNIYLMNIETGIWRNMLQNWMVEQQRNTKTSKSKINAAFFNFIYRLQENSMKFPDRGNYRLVNIISPDVIKKNCVNVTGLSAIGNLCLIPRLETSTTISRPTLYDQLDNICYTEDELKLYLYPPRNEVDFVRNNSSFGTREYIHFLRKRHTQLEDLFISLIKNNDV